MNRDLIIKNMPFKAEQKLTVVGVVNSDAAGFEVNIGQDELNYAIHINPRFNTKGDVNRVICNSYQNGIWGVEVRGGGFPFQQGKEFKIMVTFTCTEFKVTLSDGSEILFPNRIGADTYSVISFRGDACLKRVEVE
uniref:beta-galactoside-binding lectin-like isoform X1 n=1 Tax=Scatophagus argus TaxID=75038 RepID=UPI001ED81ECF|nr:beta-galactoside-binding lectin-like isoform X1 [Scatophagus argus]XP_046271937.1 beta-galactoside-binding lectin-like isoform X2 [Scatophagus argus]